MLLDWAKSKNKPWSVFVLLFSPNKHSHKVSKQCNCQFFPIIIFLKSSSLCQAVSFSLRPVCVLCTMKAEKQSHLSLPLSSPLPGSSGGLIMTLIVELLLKGGSHCCTLHLEVPCLGWVKDSQAEPIVHKDETRRYRVYSAFEPSFFFPIKESNCLQPMAAAMRSVIFKFLDLCICSVGRRFGCVFSISWSFLGSLHL